MILAGDPSRRSDRGRRAVNRPTRSDQATTSDGESAKEKPVILKEMHHVKLQWTRQFRPGQHPRTLTRHKTRGEREAELVEEPGVHDVRVQPRSALEQHRMVPGAVEVLEDLGGFYTGIPGHDKVGDARATPTLPRIAARCGEDDRAFLGLCEEW